MENNKTFFFWKTTKLFFFWTQCIWHLSYEVRARQTDRQTNKQASQSIMSLPRSRVHTISELLLMNADITAFDRCSDSMCYRYLVYFDWLIVCMKHAVQYCFGCVFLFMRAVYFYHVCTPWVTRATIAHYERPCAQQRPSCERVLKEWRVYS